MDLGEIVARFAAEHIHAGWGSIQGSPAFYTPKRPNELAVWNNVILDLKDEGNKFRVYLEDKKGGAVAKEAAQTILRNFSGGSIPVEPQYGSIISSIKVYGEGVETPYLEVSLVRKHNVSGRLAHEGNLARAIYKGAILKIFPSIMSLG